MHPQGIDFDEKGLVLISDNIRKALGGIDVSVLMGANVAREVRYKHTRTWRPMGVDW